MTADGAQAQRQGSDFAWCSTPHDSLHHPDDDDHRSTGIHLRLTVRGPGSSASRREAEVEVGLLRRTTDSDTWLVIEDGARVHLEITLDSARRLAAAIRDDPMLRAAVAPTGD